MELVHKTIQLVNLIYQNPVIQKVSLVNAMDVYDAHDMTEMSR